MDKNLEDMDKMFEEIDLDFLDEDLLDDESEEMKEVIELLRNETDNDNSVP